MMPAQNRDVNSSAPTRKQADVYDRLYPMLNAAHQEMSELSKKKQDGLLNQLKIRNINRLLDELRKVLEGHPTEGYLERLDEETLPQNSDAVLILSQWRAALNQYHNRYYSMMDQRWTVSD